ncbi:hypothetical protein A2V82_12650 [candidate division KSB1 bacterium RBG_16_48_16]|nr:MAG: hypothetical protein A2V82_12650 [candidate division KSB1 bacterium RBG_16_48_16]
MDDLMKERPATIQDIDNLRQELLSKLASKEEIKKLATKEEIKKLATQESLDNLAAIVFQQQHQMSLLETKEDANKKFDLVMSAIDGLAKNIENHYIELKSGDSTFRRHERQLENHEDRIKVLEGNA